MSVASLLKISGQFLKARLVVMHDGAALVAFGDDLEQQVGAELVDREISELVDRSIAMVSGSAAWRVSGPRRRRRRTRVWMMSMAVVKSTE